MTTLIDFTSPPSKDIPDRIWYNIQDNMHRCNFNPKYVEMVLKLCDGDVNDWTYDMSLRLCQYYLSDPTPANIEKFFPLLEKCISAEYVDLSNWHGSSVAHEIMADLYFQGTHIKKDLCMAYELYSFAEITNYSDETCIERLTELYAIGFPMLSYEYLDFNEMKEKFPKSYPYKFKTFEELDEHKYKFVKQLSKVVKAIKAGKTDAVF